MPPGTVHIIPFRTVNRLPNASDTAYAQEYYAIAGLHESFHLAMKGGYSDEQMATAAYALAGKKLTPADPKLDAYGKAYYYSALFDAELLRHCPKS